MLVDVAEPVRSKGLPARVERKSMDPCGVAMTRAVLLYLLLAFVGPSLAEDDFAPAKPLLWNWHRAQETGWEQSVLRNRTMPAPERARLLSAIAAQLQRQDFHSDDELRTSAAETRIKYVDLNRDGKLEVIAQAGGEHSGCSPTGNCPFWIFRRIGAKYAVLLSSEAQMFTIQPTRSNSFPDLVLSRHNSAFESELRSYTFDGEHYLESGCFNAEWQKLGSDGEHHRLDRPVITPCGAR
jgi:hypothetical protein